MRRFLAFLLAVILCCEPALGYAQALVTGEVLPAPGQMVRFSAAIEPVLLRGITIDPSRPLDLDFIVDPGSLLVSEAELRDDSQRMINYFLAALTVPQQDLWVNLSPVESDRIVPEALIRTELGRDLLAQDYVLKQLTASLIYPEENLGHDFWQKIYAQAWEKFGVTDLPVDAFNKVWIVPQRARVFEKGNTVFITGAEMKVMLDADHQAQQENAVATGTPEEELTKNILRELIVPAIEQEVNEGANFARLRQVVYALVLAQWYQKALKDSVLNKVYSGKSKVAGIDLSDPKNKELIYEQYMAAYRTGVFNYIKEETDPVTGEDFPRKYFSGGFAVGDIRQDAAQAQEVEAFAERPLQRIAASLEAVDGSQIIDEAVRAQFVPETTEQWNAIGRFEKILVEFQGLARLSVRRFKEEFKKLMTRYSLQYDVEVIRGNPVQGMWAVTKAVALLPQEQLNGLMDAIESVPAKDRTRLMNMMLLMTGRYTDAFVKESMPLLNDITYYFATVEMDYKQGGLGPVNETHSMFLTRLGARVRSIQLKYAMRFDTGVPGGEPLYYDDDGSGRRNLGVKNLHEVDRFDIEVGSERVPVIVEEGENRAGVTGYYIRDEWNKFSNRLYMYKSAEAPNNPVTMEESVAFFALASEAFLSRQQIRDRKADGSYPLIIVHTQDGQAAPLVQAIRGHELPGLSRDNVVILDSTHTILNAQTLPLEQARHLAENLMHLPAQFSGAAYIDRWWDPEQGGPAAGSSLFGNLTWGGLRLADAGLGVSRSHAAHMSTLYGLPLTAATNGDNPKQIAAFLEQTFSRIQQEGEIAATADIDYLSPTDVARLKKRTAQGYNQMKVRTANGELLEARAREQYGRSVEALNNMELAVILKWANETLNAGFTATDQVRAALYVDVNTDNPILGNARRLVDEKNAFDPYWLIPMLVDMGYSVVIQGNLQDTDPSRELARKYRDIEFKINRERREAKARGENRYPGQFFFVQHFTEEQKIALLGMVNGYIILNKRTLGAHEVLEENPQPNMAIQIAFDHRDGGTTDNMKPWNPGEANSVGNLLMLSYQDPSSWEQKFREMKNVWDLERDRFFRGAALGRLLNKTQTGAITAAAMLYRAQDVLKKKKDEAREKILAVQAIAVGLPDQTVRTKVRTENPDGVGLFQFNGFMFSEESRPGLEGFYKTIVDVQRRHGFNSLDGMMPYFPDYLRAFFPADQFSESRSALDAWLEAWQKAPVTLYQRSENLKAFLGDLVAALDASQAVERTGGIDARALDVERSGEWSADVLGGQSLETLVEQSRGLRGTIIRITPMTGLAGLLGIVPSR